MRIIARFKKGDAVRFVSHLDVQRLFQRAFRRAGVPMAYSQGFNPHPILAFATALSVGCTSEAEWLDIKLAQEMEPGKFMGAVNAVLPRGFCILQALRMEDNYPALSACMCAASYTVGTNATALAPAMEQLCAGPILVEKRSKAGMRTVDLRPMLYDYVVDGENVLRLTGRLDAEGSLPIELLLGALQELTGGFSYFVHRDRIWAFEDGFMPGWEWPRGISNGQVNT